MSTLINLTKERHVQYIKAKLSHGVDKLTNKDVFHMNALWDYEFIHGKQVLLLVIQVHKKD